jgi:acetylornithine/succinyldiaminopimelate/putrescine aminotransferase
MNKYLFDGFHKYVAGTSDDPMNIEIEKAVGMHLYSPEGKSYLDLIAGISVCNMGHSHPVIVDAVKKQVEKYMHVMAYEKLSRSLRLNLLVCFVNSYPHRYLPCSLLTPVLKRLKELLNWLKELPNDTKLSIAIKLIMDVLMGL